MNDLEETLRRKLQGCGEFLKATLLLSEALASEETAVIERLLDRRERLIRDIDGLDRRIDLHRREGRYARGSAIAARWETFSEEIGRTLEQIISANQACDTIAANSRETARRELMILRQKEQGLQRYADRKTERTPKFLNLQT